MFFVLKNLVPRIHPVVLFFSSAFIALVLSSCGPALPFGDDIGRVEAPSSSPDDEPPMVVDAASGALVRPAIAAMSDEDGAGPTSTMTYSGISN